MSQQEQIQREEGTFELAVEKHISRDKAAAQQGRAGRLEDAVVSQTLEAFEAIAGSMIETARGKRGPKKTWWPMVALGVTPIALLASRLLVAIETPPSPPTLTWVLRQGGKYLVGADAMRQALDEGKVTAAEARKRARVLEFSDADGNKKDASVVLGYGVLLWDILSTAGLVATKSTNSGKHIKETAAARKTTLSVWLTPQGSAVLEAAKTSPDYKRFLHPTNRPMLCEPRPWRALTGGGYLTIPCRSPLIRRINPAIRASVQGALKGAECLEAVNRLQNVALRINEDALWLRDYVWCNHIHLPTHTPRRTAIEVPPIQDTSDWPPKDRWRFLAKRSRIINLNRSLKSLDAQWTADSVEAEELFQLREQGKPFYLPHNMDYRGRTYATPTFSHQRGDAVKGLFEFHEGVPLGRDGLDGLKIHIANSCDFDKISKEGFKERIAWVDDHHDLLIACAQDPEKYRLWQRPDCDAPFSFFAAVCDYERAIASGDPENYVSHMRMDLDGSNSGVQHYAAMMRAEEGIYVSLYPSSAPQDLYKRVAQACMKRALKDSASFSGDPSAVIMAAKEERSALRADAALEGRKPTQEEKEQDEHLKHLIHEAAAFQWSQRGISRSDVKRCAMTYNYSSEAYGFADHIREDMMIPYANDVLEGRLESHPFGADEGDAAAGYLGKVTYAEVEALLPLVAEAMRWLKTFGMAVGKHNSPVRLTMPDGFPLVFGAYKSDEFRVDLLPMIGGVPKRYQARQEAPTKEINARKQQTGTPPQIIHGCDAYHLRRVVMRFTDTVSPNIMTIHDCFGAHAAHWRSLSFLCRENLVWEYADWCPLKALYDWAVERGFEVPPPPEKGKMDLRKLFKAEYAFS